jgi:electron transport complex protein RnfE
MIMGRIEAFATRNPLGPSLADSLGMGAGFTAALMLLGGVREILGSGELFGAAVLGSSYTPMLIMILPPGAFLVLGIMMAIFNHLQQSGTPILRKAG